MKRRSAIRNLLLAGAVSFFASPSSAKAGDDPGNFTIRSETRLVLLDVSVKDRNGRLVSGLSRDSFSVFENGQPQMITAFDHDDADTSKYGNSRG